MQIKTLAEILAENNQPNNSQAKNKNKQHSTTEQKTQPTQTSSTHHEPLTAEFFSEERNTSKPLRHHSRKASYKGSSSPSRHSHSYSHKSRSRNRNDNKNEIKNQTQTATKDTQTTASISTTTKNPTPKKLDIKAILQQVKAENQNNATNQTADNSNTINTLNKADNKVDTSQLDNLTSKLQDGLKTPEQRQAEIDEIKADSRLRWLAFYYLSTREHSANELKNKLLAKEQHPDKIDALLEEFAQKGYQSEMRTALMLIREGIRKGRGRRRIEQDFYQRKIDIPSNIDELIEMANAESDEFADFIDEENGEEKIDWLRLAVEARVKKYGNDIPKDNKQKAKQLRFLQYRGFKTDVCFDALRHDLTSIENI